MLISTAAHAAPELIAGTNGWKLDMAPAAVQATGRKMTVSGLQLTDPTGTDVKYYDATFEFIILPDGNVDMRLTSASPSTFAAQTTPFVAGNYSDAVGNIYRVTGPTLTATNRLEYTVSLTTVTNTAGKQQGFEATWQTGILSGNPLLDGMYNMPTMGTSAAFGKVTNNVGYFNPSGDSSTWWQAGSSYSSVFGATQTSPTTLKLNWYNGNKTPNSSVTLTIPR